MFPKPRNASYLSNGFLNVAYNAEEFPYLYTTESGALTGSIIELWNIIADTVFHAKLHIEMREYDTWSPDHNTEVYDGALGDLLKGEFFTLIDGRSLHAFLGRIKAFTPSVPYISDKYSYYEKSQSRMENTRFVYFSVFNYECLGAIVAVLITIWLIRHVAGFRVKRNDLNDVMYKISFAFFLFGITFLMFLYTAFYTGNTTFAVSTMTTFSELVAGLRSGARQHIERSGVQYSNATADFLFKGRKNTFVSAESVQDGVHQMCHDARLVGVLSEMDELIVAELGERCQLRPIDMTPVDGENHPDAYTTFTRTTYYLLYAKKIALKSHIERVNQVILRLFQADQARGFWLNRYSKYNRRYRDSPLDRREEKPFRLLQIGAVVLITVPFICLAALLFLFEVLLGNSCR